jgi:hypothetical protein
MEEGNGINAEVCGIKRRIAGMEENPTIICDRFIGAEGAFVSGGRTFVRSARVVYCV